MYLNVIAPTQNAKNFEVIIIQLCLPYRINAHCFKKVVDRSNYSNLNKEADSPTHGQTHLNKRENIPH